MVILAQKLGKKVDTGGGEIHRIGIDCEICGGEACGVRPIDWRCKKCREIGDEGKRAVGIIRRASVESSGCLLAEVLKALEFLKERNMQDCLKLLHFHLGSQITNIRTVKTALNEAARIYAELAKAGAGMEYIAVGGGLGIDYDGSQTNFESSINYSLQEYASDVVFRLKSVCDEAGVKHPNIISESGRAMVAYHSVLVFNVLGVSGFDLFDVPQGIADRGSGEVGKDGRGDSRSRCGSCLTVTAK